MSRFFQGSDSDESSSSSEDEMFSGDEQEQSDQRSNLDDDESEEGDEDEDESSESGDDAGRGHALRRDYFIKGAASDDSDEDEGKRIVKSAKDKRLEEIEATTKLIENGGKINDWVVISNGVRFRLTSY
jgi:translation initiation factor 3 subunit C